MDIPQITIPDLDVAQKLHDEFAAELSAMQARQAQLQAFQAWLVKAQSANDLALKAAQAKIDLITRFQSELDSLSNATPNPVAEPIAA